MAHPEYVDKGKSTPTPEEVQENGLSSNSLALLQFIYHLYLITTTIIIIRKKSEISVEV